MAAEIPQCQYASFSKVTYHLWLLGTVDLPLVVYYTGTLASSAQATLMMRWMGLRVENVGIGVVCPYFCGTL